MRNNLKVLVDVDGVLADLQNYAIDWIIDMGYDYDSDKCDDYYMEKGIVVEEERQFEILNTVFNNDEFWLSVPCIEGAYEGLRYLWDNFDTWIATAPWNKKNEDIKMLWIKEEFPFFNPKKVIFSDKKWELKGDIIIEDKPDTIRKCNTVGMKTICKIQPYNVDEDPTMFLYHWKDIAETMKVVKSLMGVK